MILYQNQIVMTMIIGVIYVSLIYLHLTKTKLLYGLKMKCFSLKY